MNTNRGYAAVESLKARRVVFEPGLTTLRNSHQSFGCNSDRV